MTYLRDGLLSIGSFATAARLSLKALRLYDQLGLLNPHYIDPESSYRYYHADQIHRARLIRMMREMEMPLATIRQVLAASPAEAELLVHAYWRMVEARMAQARRIVPDLVAHLYQEPIMTLDVNVRTVEPQPILSITKRVKVDQLDQTIQESLRTLYARIDEQEGDPAGPPFGLFHGPINHEDDGPLEVCVPVHAAMKGHGEAAARLLEGGKLAYVVMTGAQTDFPAILEGYDAVQDWIQKNGYRPVGSPREIWHSPPGPDARMEVAWLIEGV